MSAYKILECSLVDKTTLLAGLRELGFVPVEHQEPASLHGYQGDARNQKAHIIVPKEQVNQLFTNASNDIGFLWNEEKKEYSLIVSEYDVSSKLPGRIVQAYVKVAIETALTTARWNITERTSEKELRKRKSQVKVKIAGRKLF